MEDEVAAVTSSLRANRGAVNPTRPYPKPTMREAGRGLLRGDEVNGALKSHRCPTTYNGARQHASPPTPRPGALGQRLPQREATGTSHRSHGGRQRA
jgi:hypothetical protein